MVVLCYYKYDVTNVFVSLVTANYEIWLPVCKGSKKGQNVLYKLIISNIYVFMPLYFKCLTLTNLKKFNSTELLKIEMTLQLFLPNKFGSSAQTYG